MIRVRKAGSADYYIEASEKLGAEADRVGTKKNRTGENYYIDSSGKTKTDPLYRPLRVWGSGAKHLELVSGQTLTASQFKSLYYGFHPSKGEPLNESIPPIKEQIEAAKAVAHAEKHKIKTHKDVAHATKLLKDNPGPAAEAQLRAAQKNDELAKSHLDKMRKSTGYRRTGEEFVFSPPADVSLLHAYFLAQGNFKEAQKIEDFYLKLVEKEMERLSKYATTSAGRNDAKGIEGEPVELVYQVGVHHDARPDANNVTGHMMHAHVIVPNYGRTEDGRWMAIRTEKMKEQAPISDANINSATAIFIQQNYGGDLTFKKAKDGRLIPEFGASRLLKKVKSRIHGRSKQISENESSGLSKEQSKINDKKEKADLTGWEHIELQKTLLNEAGLTSAKIIAGSKRERKQEIRALAERRLRNKYANEIKRWVAFETRNGFPEGRPEPFRGQAARDYMLFMEQVKNARKNGMPGIPTNPLAPPGYAGHKKEFWDKAIKKEVEKLTAEEHRQTSLEPTEIVKSLSQTESFFSETDLREEIGRRVAAHPPKNLLGLKKKMTAEETLNYVRSKTDEVYREVEKSGYAVRVSRKKQIGFCSAEQRAKEQRLYGQTLPALFARDASIRSMSATEVDAFLDDWQKKQGFAFKPKQRQVARDVLGSKTKAMIIEGFAGSGKTAIAECMVAMLAKQGYRTIACAPSNSAMTQLVEEIKAGAGVTPEKLARCLGQDANTTIDENTVLYLDEVSMLNVDSGAIVLEAIRQETGARIVMSGDSRQLSSVGSGNLMEHALNIAGEAERNDPDGGKRVTKINSNYTDAVHTIQRQKSRTGRQLVAELQTGSFKEAFRTMRANGMLEELDTQTDCVEAICREFRQEIEKHVGDTPARMREYQSALKNGGDVESARKALVESFKTSTEGYRQNLILAETNESVDALATAVRRDLQKLGMIGKEDVEVQGEKGRIEVSMGERLVLRELVTSKDGRTNNQEELKKTKGTPCTVTDIKFDKEGLPILTLTFDKPNERGVTSVTLHAKDYERMPIAYGTATTVHLSQGASVDNCYSLPSANSNSELALVAASRFKEKNRMFMPADSASAIIKSMSKKERSPDALDYDRLSEEGDIESVVGFSALSERTREKVEADSRADALDAFKEKLEKADPSLAQTAEAVRRVADELRRPEVAKAARFGIVRREAGLFGRWGADKSINKSWLGETEDGEVLAYDAKTGRIEAWTGKGAKSDGVDVLARQSTFGKKLRETIRDAVEAGRTLEKDGRLRGKIVGIGVAPLHNSPRERETPFVDLVDENGDKKTVWGVDLGRALADFKVGDSVELDGDTKTQVEVFSSKKFDGGDPTPRKGTLLEKAKGNSPARVKLGSVEVKVHGKQADAWESAKVGTEIEVYAKTVEKRLWTAQAINLASAVPEADRKRAWEATERALNDPEKLDMLAKVGVGKSPFESPKKLDAKESALRSWTAGGSEAGEEAVRDWNENIGIGRKVWHEAGKLEKGDDDIARADLETMVLHADEERIYCAVAVHDHNGQLETTSTRITAFKKDELGIPKDAEIGFGKELKIRVADDLEKPQLLTNLGLNEAQTRRLRKELGDEMTIEELRVWSDRPDFEITPALAARRSETEGPTVADIPTMDGRTRHQTETKSEWPTIADIQTIDGRTRRKAEPERIEIKPTPTPEQKPRFAPRLAPRLEEKEQSNIRATEAKPARIETATKPAEVAERVEPTEPRKTLEERIREANEKARRDVATKKLTELQPGEGFVEKVIEELELGADPLANDATRTNALLAYAEDGRVENVTDIIAKCSSDKRVASLILLADAGLLDDKLLRNALKTTTAEEALDAGLNPTDILRESPTNITSKTVEMLISEGADPHDKLDGGMSFYERFIRDDGAKEDSAREATNTAPAPAPAPARVAIAKRR